MSFYSPPKEPLYDHASDNFGRFVQGIRIYAAIVISVGAVARASLVWPAVFKSNFSVTLLFLSVYNILELTMVVVAVWAKGRFLAIAGLFFLSQVPVVSSYILQYFAYSGVMVAPIYSDGGWEWNIDVPSGVTFFVNFPPPYDGWGINLFALQLACLCFAAFQVHRKAV